MPDTRAAPRANAASSTGTTRWCPSSASTSRASRPSWTWTWCPSTPTRTRPRPPAVSIDPRMQQNLGVRLAEVEKSALEGGAEAVGTVRVDETRIRVVQSRVAGFVEQQPVRTLNQSVTRGQLLLTLTAPELIATQHELLLALKSGDAALTGARAGTAAPGRHVGAADRGNRAQRPGAGPRCHRRAGVGNRHRTEFPTGHDRGGGGAADDRWRPWTRCGSSPTCRNAKRRSLPSVAASA